MIAQKDLLTNVRANAVLARAESDIGRKIDYLATAIEELANSLDEPGNKSPADPRLPPRIFDVR